ncbi:AAA family ATPase [Candidatus Bathyarchaeota archaeon A05DMB-2]|jgi:septum site-determining protein MinD|nr:AAA family ATPase [Candidatus Bathyarchaeota archaeon A05DMB-2]
MRKKAISIHSSRGGTGKTVIATNLAAIYAVKGVNVALLDLDFCAPSLVDVFSKGISGSVKHWLNDFLDGRCRAEQALIDVSKAYGLKGKLLLGLANPSIEAIRNMMEKSRAWEVTAVKRLFSLRSRLFDAMDVYCCILDTSPGVQYMSVNAVVSSDIAVAVATLDSLDLKGLENMLAELYDAFAKRSVVLINKVFPETRVWSSDEQTDLIGKMEKTLKHRVIGVIPCYCDVLQAKRTSLLAVDKPYHPFLRNLEEVAEKLDGIKEVDMEEQVLAE